MEYKVGDKVKITRRDGIGNIGTITKVSEIDPIAKYEITVNEITQPFWKAETSIEYYDGIAPIKHELITGKLGHGCKLVALYDDDKLIKIFGSIKEAAKQLGVSYHTIENYIAGKCKKPKFDTRLYLNDE